MIRDVSIEQAPAYIEWLIEFLDKDWVHRAVADYRAHPYRAYFRLNCNSLVPGITAYQDWSTATSSVHSLPDDAVVIARHAAHIQALRSSWEVPPVDENVRYLRSSLQDRRKVDGTLYEFLVAYHYHHQGYDVELLTVTNREGFDILVSSDLETTVEIECKTTKRGAGRKVHHDVFEGLVARLWPMLEAGGRICLLDLRCEDRLEESDLDTLAVHVAGRLQSGEEGVFDIIYGRYHLTLREVGDSQRPLTIQQADKLVKRFWQDPTRRPHVFAAVDNTAAGIPSQRITLSLLVCRSNRPDNVFRPLMAALSKASEQLTGTRPGLVSIHIPEPIDWGMLPPESNLNIKVQRAFDNHHLQHVSGVALSGLPTEISRGAVLEGNTPAISWLNPNALHALPAQFRPARRP